MATRPRAVIDVPSRHRPELGEVRVLVLPDDQAGAEGLDPERAAALERGEFAFVGVLAEADVTVEGVVQQLRSGGNWGIESDDRGYLEEVAADEYADLRKILKTIGVSTAELPTDMNPEWIEWRV